MTRSSFSVGAPAFLFLYSRRPLLVTLADLSSMWGRGEQIVGVGRRHFSNCVIGKFKTGLAGFQNSCSTCPSPSHHISTTPCETTGGRPSTIGPSAFGFQPPDQIRNYDSIAQLRVGPEPSPPDLATCHSHSHHPPPLTLPDSVLSLGTCQDIAVATHRVRHSPWSRGSVVPPDPTSMPTDLYQGSTAPKHPRQRDLLVDPYITARPQ